MDRFEWSESFSVGDVLMDAHHQIFFRMLNRLNGIVAGNNQDTIREYLSFLNEYVTMHFRAEEELMLHAGCPEFDDHKEIHDAFIQQLLYIEEAFDTDPTSLNDYSILKIMQDWFANHIICSDKRCMTYFKK